MSPLYRLEGVEHRVLRVESLEIPAGVTVVMGPNGSGKTTLLRLLARAEKPVRGRVHGPSRVGSAWRNPYLSFRGATVLEDLAGQLGTRRALRVLEEYGLLWARDKSPFTLSVGQARILSVLLAVSWGPEAVVLDEPTTGLSPRLRAWLSLWLRGLGVPVVLATHDLETAVLAGDYMIVLSRGKPTTTGPIEEAVRPAARFLGYPETSTLRAALEGGVEECRRRVRDYIQRVGPRLPLPG